MSEHYRQREYSGCTGCVAVIVLAVIIDVLAVCGIWQLVTWLLGS